MSALDSIAHLRPFIQAEEFKAYNEACAKDSAAVDSVRNAFVQAQTRLESAKLELKRAKAQYEQAHKKYFAEPLYAASDKLRAEILAKAEARRAAHLADGGTDRFETGAEATARLICETMGKSKDECRCPDCGPCLVDYKGE